MYEVVWNKLPRIFIYTLSIISNPAFCFYCVICY